MTRISLIGILLLASASAKRIETDPCPTACSCPGNAHVDCSNLNLTEIPLDIGPRTSRLNLASNSIQSIPNYAFKNLKKLSSLCLKDNGIRHVAPHAFDGLGSLKVLEINGNKLVEVPEALASLSLLKELVFSDNKIRFLRKTSFSSNRFLTNLELSGNPIESGDLSKLPFLKKLTLSETRFLEDFPAIQGTSSLQQLRIDRAQLKSVPRDLCSLAPSLRSLDLKSNRLTVLPFFRGCKELRLIDLSYNTISAIEDFAFSDQENLIDLFLAHNLISQITKDTFRGLINLHVLDLESNAIERIHPDAFIHFKELRDLNVAANTFSHLPTRGLQNLRHLKTFNNRELKDFPPVESFPRISHLALSYAYHCCAFLFASFSSMPGSSVRESIVWLSKDELDMAHWSPNRSYSGNFSFKLEELWKTYGRDYSIPDNLAQYAEEYAEDYKSSITNEDNPLSRFVLQCLPQPGPFMPCEDLFGWWSLRCGVWVVFLLALLGNGIVVIVLILRRSKMDVPRFLVCNLAAADFLMGGYLGILAVVDAATLGQFKVSAIQWQSSLGCQVAGFLGVLSSELSVFTLSVITLERNYAITHAMRLNKRLSLRHASYIMFLGWSFAVAMASLPLVGISDYKKFAICLPFETEDLWSLIYVVFLMLINGVAFLILMGCYFKMYCAIRGSSAWNSNDSRIARRMALLVFTDFICYAPIAFCSLTALCGYELISLEEAKVFAIFVLPLNSCANPFLYAIFTKQFKKDCVHICKRIEESRVTRGIGRGRHSSNFSNRQTPGTSNSAANPGSDTWCQCAQSKGWREWASKYILCSTKPYARAQIQKNWEKNKSSIVSENFSSRSDSWRQGTIPLKILDEQDVRRDSWLLKRKVSEDSSMSCSRQDSSTSTFPMSRSSFSSESSSQPIAHPPTIGNNKKTIRATKERKYKLCRQSALPEEKNLDQLCPVCAKKEIFQRKELEEKFASFYNKLVESSSIDSRDYSSKEDRILSSSAIPPPGDRASVGSETMVKDALPSRQPIQQNPIAECGDGREHCESDNISKNPSNSVDQDIDKCKSLTNINIQSHSENKEESSSVGKLLSINLPAVFRSFPILNEETKQMNSSGKLRYSKSENNVPNCEFEEKEASSDKHPSTCGSNKSKEALNVDLKFHNLVSTNDSHCPSSPNPSIRSWETSPLLDTNE